MTTFFSKKTLGFYPDSPYGGEENGPYVEITDLMATDLLRLESQGFEIKIGKDGFPQAVARPTKSPDTLEEVQSKRLMAYRNESDFLKSEAEYDAIIGGVEPDYSRWVEKVAEIKERYPLPKAS